jgi:hypothetical protein
MSNDTHKKKRFFLHKQHSSTQDMCLSTIDLTCHHFYDVNTDSYSIYAE